MYFCLPQEDFENEMQTLFSDIQRDLSKVTSAKTGSEDSLKIHEMSQVCVPSVLDVSGSASYYGSKRSIIVFIIQSCPPLQFFLT